MKDFSSTLPPVSERIRPGVRERSLRRTEAFLLVFALLVFAAGVAVVLFAKLPLEATKTPLLNINTASATQLANVLHVPPAIGEKLITERTRQGKTGFEDSDAIARFRVDKKPVVPYANYAAAEEQLIVRTPEAARKIFLFWCGGLGLFFIIAHLLLRFGHPKADPFLLPITALLSFLSILLLFALKDPLRDGMAYAAQASGILVGGAVTLLVVLSAPFGKLPLHRYGYLYALMALVLCGILGVLGSGPGGVHLSVGGVQPVEAVKILMVFFLAAYLAERGPLLDDPLRRIGPFPLPRPKDALPLLTLYALPLALFGIVRDLGPALLLFGIFVILLYLATARSVYVWTGVALLLVGGFLGYKLNLGVFGTRLDMWLHPWNNTHPNGNQLALGLWGMASGGPLGSGLGLGGTRFIPRGGSDLALASLGEETGIVGPVAVLLCALLIVARGFSIARRAATDFDRYLATGLSGLFGLQVLLIASGTLGLFPLSGVTLPFISFGRSSLLASFFMIGVLLHLSSRIPPGSAALTPPPRPWEATARRVGLFFFLTLGIGCTARLIYVQLLASDAIAARIVSTPDADKVKRPHVNPRLLSLSAQIHRGRILDRKGIVLATTRPDGKRVYPRGAATGHLIGYMDPAIGGPTGIEKQFNESLRGYKNYASLVPLWRRKDLPGFKLPQGQDVTLALDADLQQVALDALKQQTASLRDRRTGHAKQRGAAVVLDVQTGAVLVAATLPTYDPNALTPAIMRYLNANLDHDYPLINRAIAGYYPPGSTFKIVTGSAQFDAGLADFTYNCQHADYNVIWTAGGQTYARRRVVDDEGERGHGLTNLTEAVAESCNVYFARAGIKLGPTVLRDHAARYGFAHLPTGPQFDAALPEIAFGQGEMQASPMEMADVALTVANAGKRLAPRWEKKDAPLISDTPLTPENAARLADMMHRVTISGTAANRFDDLSFSVAGKTGTAQNDRYDKVAHSWFIGFAPVDKPRIAFAVLVENGGYGAQSAVPITHTILKNISP